MGKTAPKKKPNKRGKRSKEKTEERIQKGINKRLERQQERVEAQYPELVGQASSSTGPARTVLVDTEHSRKVVEEERGQKTLFPGERRHKGIVLKENSSRAAGGPAPGEEKNRKRRRKRRSKKPLELKSVPREQLRLKSVPKLVRNLNLAKRALSVANRDWTKHSFAERIRAKRFIKNLLPKGTVAETLLSVPEACSSCDERGKQNRPVAAQFAAARLARRREEKAEGAIPIDDPHFDPTPARRNDRTTGDGSSSDSTNFRSPRRHAAAATGESSDE